MRGEVLEFDAATGGGVLADEYGARYAFDGAAAHTPLSIGSKVDFTPDNGVARDIYILPAEPDAGPVWAAAAPVQPGYDFAKAMFSFNGRLRRSHYWLSWAILFGAGLLITIIPFIGVIGLILMTWPNLAKDVKRLHDMGRSGWWVAIPYGAGVVGYIAFAAVLVAALAGHLEPLAIMHVYGDFAGLGPMIGITAIVFVFQISFWLWFGLQDSQKGDNQWGPNPKGE